MKGGRGLREGVERECRAGVDGRMEIGEAKACSADEVSTGRRL